MVQRYPNTPFGQGMHGPPRFGMGPPPGMQHPPFGQQFPRQQQGGFFPRGPMQGQGQTQPKSGGGGLLAKILGRGGSKTAAPVSPFSLPGRSAGAAASSGGSGILSSLTNPGALTGFLTNTQKILNTAQQVGPMVQQYGPMVKNLPAMWKMYRSLKSADTGNDGNETEAVKESHESSSSVSDENKKHSPKSNGNSNPPSEEHSNESGVSRPRLFF
ncbi:VrrA/YqfQ family protein [Peribacillus kribbensis]|uniref:VrrA/YqfQ family protein n=1 Tax=Peribacillus kribbensis TaxID=356658 RepID=UPI0006857505|nr:VrrA/YqfQ family protein [Peribacillus kribbensis]